MKGNPAGPGGLLTSKPTWSNAFWVFGHVGFFCAVTGAGRSQPRMNPMEKSNLTMAQQIAKAASDFEQQRSGHVPKSVNVVLSVDTLDIKLGRSLSSA